jgi:integrase/recombinase XerD
MEAHLIDKRHIQAFFYYLLQETETIVGGNGARRKVTRTEDSLWPYYRCLRRFFGWAVKEGYLNQNPAIDLGLKPPRNRPIEPWRREHIDQMFQVLDHDWKIATTPRQRMLAARDHAIVSLFLESFVRLEELAGLNVEDVDLQAQRLLVRKGKMGKGRWAGFGPATRKSLWRYLGLREPLALGNALWISEEGRQLTSRGIQQVFRRLKRDAGLQHIQGSIHKMRHTGATIHYRHNRDMKGLKMLLGHATYDMTERYTSFVETEDALELYEDGGPLDWMHDRKRK